MKTCVILILFLSFEVVSIFGNVAQRSCSTADECNTSECCVTRTPPRGRRSKDTKRFLNDGGICQPMGESGGHCYAGRGTPGVAPKEITIWCPCASGYNCRGTGLFEVPQGEIGVCV